ncbi:predicted protein [Lichtheimia corymbifera JMRC:FSU:9682]|uniref:Uncharacterized protein n=1 Tax=Lichtheimia corymbifera JMRC:FSU:9682 TaxID=1263082 RepID=A0A068S0H5_9FUNG|nr:predicted protein [Lichtheimia corymbifera JMRC:FSU:9682]
MISSGYRQFGGHSEMKVSYGLIMSTTRNTCISLVSQAFDLWWSWLLGNWFQEHSAAHLSYGCVTSAAGNDGYVPFWCFQGLLTAQGIRRQVSPPSFGDSLVCIALDTCTSAIN